MGNKNSKKEENPLLDFPRFDEERIKELANGLYAYLKKHDQKDLKQKLYTYLKPLVLGTGEKQEGTDNVKLFLKMVKNKVSKEDIEESGKEDFKNGVMYYIYEKLLEDEFKEEENVNKKINKTKDKIAKAIEAIKAKKEAKKLMKEITNNNAIMNLYLMLSKEEKDINLDDESKKIFSKLNASYEEEFKKLIKKELIKLLRGTIMYKKQKKKSA